MTLTATTIAMAILFALGVIVRAWGEDAEARQLRRTALLLRPDSEDGGLLEPAQVDAILERTKMVLGTTKLSRLIGMFLLIPSGILIGISFSPGPWGLAISTLAIFLVFLVLHGAALSLAVRRIGESSGDPPSWLLDREIHAPLPFVIGSVAWERAQRVLDSLLAPARLGRPQAQLIEQDDRIHLHIVTPAEQRAVQSDASESGERTEERMIRAITRLDRTLVREIMRPINQVTAIRLKDFTSRRFLDLCRRTGFTRLPCYEDQITNLIGYINVYDVLENDKLPRDLRALVTEALYVPEVARVDAVLKEMISRKQQIAIVFDEFGGTSGLLSREDIIEEIVGDVGDEYERPRRMVIESRGGYLVDPSTDLDDLREEIGMVVPKRNCDTVAGYVYARLGRVPRRGEVVEENGWQIRVAAMDGHRIRRLRVVPVSSEEPRES